MGQKLLKNANFDAHVSKSPSLKFSSFSSLPQNNSTIEKENVIEKVESPIKENDFNDNDNSMNIIEKFGQSFFSQSFTEPKCDLELSQTKFVPSSQKIRESKIRTKLTPYVAKDLDDSYFNTSFKDETSTEKTIQKTPPPVIVNSVSTKRKASNTSEEVTKPKKRQRKNTRNRRNSTDDGKGPSGDEDTSSPTTVTWVIYLKKCSRYFESVVIYKLHLLLNFSDNDTFILNVKKIYWKNVGISNKMINVIMLNLYP